MTAEEIRALVHRFFEEWNKGKAAAMAVIDETCVVDYVFHAAGRDIRGVKDFKQYCRVLFHAFPDNQLILNDLIVEGDKAAYRYTMAGTHKGELMGVPPSNNHVTMESIEIDLLAGGKFVESWSRSDMLGLMQQLGVVPMPRKAK